MGAPPGRAKSRLGEVGLLHAVQARDSNFFWLGAVVAALNLAAGVVVISKPEAAAEALTMFAALLFLTGGVFRWTLVQGAFGLLLGILVLASWPSSSKYVIGTFVSLALLFDGLSLVATGYGGRHVVRLVSHQTRTTRIVPDSAQGGQEQSHN